MNEKINFKPRGLEKHKNIFVGKNTKISSKAKLKGHIVIGSNSIVGDNVEMEENVVIGNNCQILRGSRLKNCLLWSGIIVGENAILNGCILADDVKIYNNSYIGTGIILGADTKITKFSILNRT